MKLYQYTRYFQDGKEEALEPRKQMKLHELQQEVGGSNIITIVPRDYYAHQKWGRCTVYVDDEGAMDSRNTKNPFFTELAPGYMIVGKALKEEVYHADVQ